MAWSEEAKERAAARRVYMLDEVIEAVEITLEELGCNEEGHVIPKETLIPIVAKRVEEDRRMKYSNGIYLKLPTIENTEVRLPDANFILNNWSRMAERAADLHSIYIVWEGGKNGGVRLGTLEEYHEQQTVLGLIVYGGAEKHNRRADIINRKKGNDEAGYIGLWLPTPNE